MNDQTIRCPHCAKDIPLTAALTSHIETDMREKMKVEWNKRLEDLQAEKQKLVAAAKVEAEQKVGLELKDLKCHEAAMKKQLEEAQKNELELRKKSRELEEQKQNMELEMQRKLDKERAQLIEKAKTEASDEMGRKM